MTEQLFTAIAKEHPSPSRRSKPGAAIHSTSTMSLSGGVRAAIELNGIKHHKGAELTLGLPSHLIEHFLEEFFRHSMGNAHDVQRKFVKSFQGSGKRRTSLESKPFEKRISA